MLRRIRLIITDLDQTLFDSHELKLRAFRHALATLSDSIRHDVRLPDAIDLEEVYLGYGHSWPDHVDVGLDDSAALDVGRMCREHMVSFVESGSGRLQPGVLEYLLSCREEGAVLAIGAEAHREYLLAVSDRFGLSDAFECSLCTGEYGTGGADEMLEDALSRCEALAGETVYVGTRPDTLEAARFLGITALVGAWGLHGEGMQGREEPRAADVQALAALIAGIDAELGEWGE